MYDRILFPIDGRENTDTALSHVLDIAVRHGATLHILNVADTTHESVVRVGNEVVDALVGQGERAVDRAADRAAARNVPTVTAVHQGGVPGSIVAYAETHDVDLVAMPTQGRTGFTRLLLGSVTERVLRQTSVPVLTLPPGDSLQYPYRDVLVPTDGSECAGGALDHAVATVDATLHVLSVVESPGPAIDITAGTGGELLETTARRVVETAATTASDAGLDQVLGRVETGDSVAGTIESYVDANEIDLVVMGTCGRQGLEQHLLGSSTERTVRTVSVPVVTVPDSVSS